MKKISLILLFTLLASCFLGACADQETPTPETIVITQMVEGEVVEVVITATPEPEVEVEPVTLDVWYIPLANWGESLAEIVPFFEAENPDVKINLVTVPYGEFDEKLAVSIPVGEGPDVLGPYHGLVGIYKKKGLLAPIPEDVISFEELQETLVPGANDGIYDGQYYVVPYYMMNYAVFYNKDYFAENGITEIPSTWEEFRETAKQCTKRDDDGNLVYAGYYQFFPQQGHIIFMQVIENFGQQPFSDDWKTVQWNASETAYEAFEWWMDLTLVDESSEPYFSEGQYFAFYTGQSCMCIAGPQVIGSVKANAPDLNWGTFPMVTGPAADKELANANVSQYWGFSISSQAAKDPVRYNAAGRFLKFLTSEGAQRVVTRWTGALPSINSLMDDPIYTEDEYLKAFIETLPNSHTIFWADTYAEREIQIAMYDKIFLEGEDVGEVLDWGTEEVQKIRDDYFSE